MLFISSATETTNFYYLCIILFSLLVMTGICVLILKSDFGAEKIDKVIELFKYTIVTIGIGTVAFIVTDSFKERDYDKDEMIVFNQYLPYITDTTATLDKKINFCKFFSSVTPEGDLQKGWTSYTKYLVKIKDSIDKQSKKASIEVEDLFAQASKPEINTSLARIETETIQTQKILENVDSAANNDSYVVVISSDTSIDETTNEVKWAKDNLNLDATVYYKGKWYVTTLLVNTGFKDAQKLAAEVREKTKTAKLKKHAFVISTSLWCKSAAKSPNGNYMVCN